MIFSFGGISFNTGAASVKIARRLSRSSTGSVQEKKTTYTIEGKVLGADASTILAGVAQVESLADFTSADFSLAYDDETVVESLTAAACTRGPYVVSVEYPSGDGPEWAPGAYRSWQIVIEAVWEQPSYSPGGGSVTADTFSETVAISGGGARTAFVEVLDDTPAGPFTLCPSTLVEVTQSGSATSDDDYPDPADPLFAENADVIQKQAPRISKTHADTNGEDRYTTAWEYAWIARVDLDGEPN